MTTKQKRTIVEKEKQLLEKIEKAKADLDKLRKKRIIECGQLVVKHGLDQFENKILDNALAQLAKQLNNES